MIKEKKATIVRKHTRHVSVSKKNPSGVTVVDRHIRHLNVKTKEELLKEIKDSSENKKIIYPHSGPSEFKNADKYDQIIAEAVDFFNTLFQIEPPFDPDMIKALIASESGFRLEPKENNVALGIAQITKQTLKVLQDPKGELKENLYKGIRQKDLLVPEVAIPLMVRWLVRKREIAKVKLNREPTVEEIILEYKGLLKSKTNYQERALENFKDKYAKLKNSFYISIIFLFVFLSCSIAQPSYKILKVNEDGIEILLSSNRAYVTCENASGDDKVHILLLHILNDKNTVDDFIHGLAYPKEDCMSLKSAIERVIMNGKQIYLAGSGSGKVNLKYEDESYKFRDLGQFPFSKIVFGFRMIKNEKGQCYRFGVGDEKEESCK